MLTLHFLPCPATLATHSEDAFTQHDLDELIAVLLEALEVSAGGDALTSPAALFHGVANDVLTFSDPDSGKRHRRVREDPFSHISLWIDDTTRSLEAALERYDHYLPSHVTPPRVHVTRVHSTPCCPLYPPTPAAHSHTTYARLHPQLSKVRCSRNGRRIQTRRTRRAGDDAYKGSAVCTTPALPPDPDQTISV
jgi:hypothetical protein